MSVTAFSGFLLALVVVLALTSIILLRRNRQQEKTLQSQLQVSRVEVEQLKQALNDGNAKQLIADERLARNREELSVALDEIRQLKEKLEASSKLAANHHEELLVCRSVNQGLDEQLAALKLELDTRHQDYQSVDAAFRKLSESHTRLQTEQKEKEQQFQSQLALLEENRQQLKIEFQQLAQQIFEDRGKVFAENSKQSMETLLSPFREQIEQFRKRVDEVHTQSVRGNESLKSELQRVMEMSVKMHEEAHNLTRALKGDKKAQGTWGEVQVETLLEMSGLHKGREYEREASFRDDENRQRRPDFIVKMPNGKHIIIDSKVSLNDYVNFTASRDEAAAAIHLEKLVKAIRNHVGELSAKNYPKLHGIEAPEFVFMFMPVEPAYLAAFNHDPNLFEDAYRKGIAIVTPNTLLSSLSIVAHLWSIDKQNSHTRLLAEQASKVYDKLRIFVEKMQRLGNQIDTVKGTWEDSWNTLRDGRGSLARQVDQFVDLGVQVKQKLPASVITNDEVDVSDRSLALPEKNASDESE